MAKKQELWDAALASKDKLKELGVELPESQDEITVPKLEAALKTLEDDTQKKDNDKEEPENKGGKLLKNLRKNPISVAGVKIAPEGQVELSKAQLSDERLMKKINHGIKNKMWKWV